MDTRDTTTWFGRSSETKSKPVWLQYFLNKNPTYHNWTTNKKSGIKYALQFSHALVHNVLKTHIGEDVPAIADFGRNLSFALQNGHFSVSNPRPYLPSVAEIGCIHCKPAKPLPKVRVSH